MTKTQIAVTIGPASSSQNILNQLIAAGARIFRFPFGHEAPKNHFTVTKNLMRIASALGETVYTMQDVPGTKKRLRNPRTFHVKRGEKLSFTHKGAHLAPTSPIIMTNLSSLSGITEWARVFFGDGEVEAVVEDVDDLTAVCRIVNDGPIFEDTTLTVQGVTLADSSGLMDFDKRVIRDGVELAYDYIAISFVRSPEEIREARAFIRAEVPHSPKLIVKLETAEAAKEHLDEIIDLVDGVMVARGDLALQVDYAEMGVLQRRIVQKATAAGKEVMVATNVLESVRANRVPNRAEISDITTSVALGASCILLSGETRQGAQPVYTVEVLKRVIEASERLLHQLERE